VCMPVFHTETYVYSFEDMEYSQSVFKCFAGIQYYKIYACFIFQRLH
jgi:hypothetical protein